MQIKSKFFQSTLYLLRMDNDCPEYDLQEGYTIHKLEYDHIETAAKIHRNPVAIKDRLDSGDIAYWIEHENKCINIQWYSVTDYFVWDIRSFVTFSRGSSYLYDGFTDPAYRGKGINKAALSSLIREAGLLSAGSIYSLTQKSNPMGWGFLEKFGFKRMAEVSLLQVPPFRRFSVLHDGAVHSRFSLMLIHNKPARLNLDTVRFVR